MSEYAVVAVTVAALAAFAELVSYSGGEDRGHKLAVSVIVLYSLIAPLVPIAESLGDFDISELVGDGAELSGGAYIEVGEESFSLGIRRAVCEKWGLDEDSVIVTVVGFDFENMRADLILISLIKRGITVDYREIEAYIEEAGLGKCEVKYAY